VLEHREQQQVLQPHHGQLRPARDGVGRSRPEGARPLGHLEVPPEVAWLRHLRLGPLVVRGGDGHGPLGAVAQVEHERGVEGPEAVEVGRVEPARGVGEADLGHGAGRVRPPGVDGAVGQPGVGGQVAEEVEGQRRRPQQVGPEALVVEALVRFGDGGPGPGRRQGVGVEEGGAGLAGVVEREAAPDRPRRLAAGPGHDRLGPDGVAVGLAPPRLVVAQPAAEPGHGRAPGHLVVGLPAVRGLQLLSRHRRSHAEDCTRGQRPPPVAGRVSRMVVSSRLSGAGGPALRRSRVVGWVAGVCTSGAEVGSSCIGGPCDGFGAP
jgi:hypothetical protein